MFHFSVTWLRNIGDPHVLGHRAFCRITVENADSGAATCSNVANDQAGHALQECLVSHGMI
jgi:spermidine dehydrogenase